MEIDCESKISALETVSQAFGCAPLELTDALKSINIHKIYEENGRDIMVPPEDYLFSYIEKLLGSPSVVTSVCWFHTTRTTQCNIYSRGILPLGAVLDDIWNVLIENSPSTEIRDSLSRLKDKGSSSFQYNLKVSDQIHWGPYGILVRDVAFHTQTLGQHDYLGMPEIIEDLLQGCPDTEIDLLLHYSDILVPKIVKFRSTQGVDYALGTALCYAHDCAWGLTPQGWSVTCFDGENECVPHSEIIEVEAIPP